MRGDQVAVIRINRQVVESLSSWSREVELRYLFQRLTGCLRRESGRQDKDRQSCKSPKQFSRLHRLLSSLHQCEDAPLPSSSRAALKEIGRASCRERG